MLPNLGKRPATTARRFAAFLVQLRSRWLVRQRPAGVVNARLWEFPNVEIPERASLSDAAAQLFGARVRKLEPLTTIRHSITRYRISVEASLTTLADRGPSRKRANWLSLAELDRLPFTSAHRKLLDTLRRNQGLAAADR